MTARKRKKKKYRMFWFLAKMQLVLLLAVIVGACWYYFGGYAEEVKDLKTQAVELVRYSNKETFKANQTSIVYASDESVISTLKGGKDSYYLSITDIPSNVICAIVSIEDKKFFRHNGIDYRALVRAVKAMIENGEATQGGSTITMQLARNIFLSQEKTWQRKVEEMYIARELEKKYTKDEILEFYLNNIYFGNGYYGIQSASRGYFNRDVQDLDLSEQVFLCAIPNNPTLYDPVTNITNTYKRRNRILKNMLDDINISTDGLQVFGTTSHRKTLIAAVIDAVKELGADGINLDVETIKSDVGPSYIQFIRELSAACRKEKLVLSVDNYSPMPHTAFYDRTQQGQVVDYVVVMAYDEHYVKGPEAGSTSSLAFVKQSAERTIAEVPKEKVIVGLPFYSRLWCETPAESESDKTDNSQVFVDNSDGTYDSKNNKYLLSSKGVSMEGENNIIREHDLSLTWLDDVGQFYTEYEENGSWYRLWVEDENSMDLKMQAACSYEPGGVAFFKLNMENKETWSIIRKYTDK